MGSCDNFWNLKRKKGKCFSRKRESIIETFFSKYFSQVDKNSPQKNHYNLDIVNEMWCHVNNQILNLRNEPKIDIKHV